jgi:single-strand DNA-binding protein
MTMEDMPNTMAKVQMVGWLRGELNIKETGSGKKVLNAQVYCGKSGTHRVTFWEDDAVNVAAIGPGAQVFIEGRLSRRSYEKDGVTVWQTDITAYEIRVLSAGGAAESF